MSDATSDHTTEYFHVWYDEQEQDGGRWPPGLYRRVRADDGRVIAEDAYHPDRGGWVPTEYWLRLHHRGGDEKHLVAVPAETAAQTRSAIDEVVAERNRPA